MLASGLIVQYTYGLPWSFFALIGVFFLSSILKDSILRYPKMTLPQRYSLLLLRLLQRAEESPPKRFEHTLRNLTGQIDLDLGELKENLAASRTVNVLTKLRLLLLKFATGVTDTSKTVSPADLTGMKETIGQAASSFYAFEDVDAFLKPLADELDKIKSIPPHEPTVSPWHTLVNLLRPWYRLPFSVHLLTLLAVALLSAWVVMVTRPEFVIVVPISLGVFAIFQGQLRNWLRTTFAQQQAKTLQEQTESA